MLKISRKLNKQSDKILHRTIKKFLVNVMPYEINQIQKTNFTLIRLKYLNVFLERCTSAYNSFSQQRNICLISGRSRAVYKIFKLSRIQLKYFANKGSFLGFSKTS